MSIAQIIMGTISQFNTGEGGGGGGGPVADFTIEWWQKVENSGNNPRPWSVGLYPTQKLSLSYESLSADYFWINDSVIMTTNQNHVGAGWRHIAYVRSGNFLRGYINGTLYTNVIGHSDAITDTATPLYVGTGELAAGMYQGYITDLHIMKGVAKYTGNFTAPTAYQTPNQSGSVFLLPAYGDGTGVDTVGSKNPVGVGTLTTSSDIPFSTVGPYTITPTATNSFVSEIYILKATYPDAVNIVAGWTVERTGGYTATVTSTRDDTIYHVLIVNITSGSLINGEAVFTQPNMISYYFDGSSYLNYGASPDWAMDV